MSAYTIFISDVFLSCIKNSFAFPDILLLHAKACGIKLRVSKVVDTNKISNHSGSESTICEYILVSTDTNLRSIGIELIILVSPITTKDHGKMYTPPSFLLWSICYLMRGPTAAGPNQKLYDFQNNEKTTTLCLFVVYIT